MAKVKRFERRVDPPSIFPDCSPSMLPQTFAGGYTVSYIVKIVLYLVATCVLFCS